jgi:hypothetical protein
MRKSIISVLSIPLLLLSMNSMAIEFKQVGQSRFEYYFLD